MLLRSTAPPAVSVWNVAAGGLIVWPSTIVQRSIRRLTLTLSHVAVGRQILIVLIEGRALPHTGIDLQPHESWKHDLWSPPVRVVFALIVPIGLPTGSRAP